jgi:hypothetical protein
MTTTHPGQPTHADVKQQPINIEKMKVLTEMFKEPAELMQLNALEVNEVHGDAKPMHLPWILGPNDTSVIYDNNGDIVCYYNDEYQAELIVRAVNRAPAFDAMVEALENLVAACENDFLGSVMDDAEDCEAVGSGLEGDMALQVGHIRKARAALKLAKGEA